MKKSFLAVLACLAFCVSSFSQQAEKIDEFENIPCDDYLSRMDAAIGRTYMNPFSEISILIYEGRHNVYNSRKHKIESVLPAVGETRAIIKSIKDYLLLKKVPADKFSFVEAGLRENLSVEIWLVPTGATLPQPTPTLQKMKRRKGKALRFCTDCC